MGCAPSSSGSAMEKTSPELSSAERPPSCKGSLLELQWGGRARPTSRPPRGVKAVKHGYSVLLLGSGYRTRLASPSNKEGAHARRSLNLSANPGLLAR